MKDFISWKQIATRFPKNQGWSITLQKAGSLSPAPSTMQQIEESNAFSIDKNQMRFVQTSLFEFLFSLHSQIYFIMYLLHQKMDLLSKDLISKSSPSRQNSLRVPF